MTWRDDRTRPVSMRIVALSLGAGLIAIYGVMGTCAAFGLWRSNLFSLNSNWPWAFPLAGLSLIGWRWHRQVLMHAIVFLPLLAMQGLMLAYYRAAGVMKVGFADVWYLPVALLAIAVINMVAFRQLTRGEVPPATGR